MTSPLKLGLLGYSSLLINVLTEHMASCWLIESMLCVVVYECKWFRNVVSQQMCISNSSPGQP